MPNNNVPQAVLDEIAEIIRRVGKREDVESEIVENVNFALMVSELMKQEGPVKDMAVRVISNHLKNIEIESDSDQAVEILEAIDFKKFVPSLMNNPDFQEVITNAIQDMLENGNLDISDSVAEAVNEKDISKIIGEEGMQKAIAQKLQRYVEDFDMSELGDDNLERLDATLFSPERVEEYLQSNIEEVNDLLMKRIQDFLEGMDDDEENPIAAVITESKTFQTAVNKAVNELIDSGKVDRLVEKVATEMLEDGDSDLRDRLVSAVSTQLVNKIANVLVDRMMK